MVHYVNIFAISFLQCEIDGEIEYEFPCYNRENFDGMWWNANDQVENLETKSDTLKCFVSVKISLPIHCLFGKSNLEEVRVHLY